MWFELWKSASSSVTSAFSLGNATKGALILAGIGIAAIGVGMILKGTATVVSAVHDVRDRDLNDDSLVSDDKSEESAEESVNE